MASLRISCRLVRFPDHLIFSEFTAELHVSLVTQLGWPNDWSYDWPNLLAKSPDWGHAAQVQRMRSRETSRLVCDCHIIVIQSGDALLSLRAHPVRRQRLGVECVDRERAGVMLGQLVAHLIGQPDYLLEVREMQSLMILHRSLMQSDLDDGFECNRSAFDSEAVNRRTKERADLLQFLTTRGLDQAARFKRRPSLRVVENCGSELRQTKPNGK